MQDWRACMGRAGQVAGIPWPRSFAEAGPEIDRFLLQSRRHHMAAEEAAVIGPAPVSEMINATWLALRRLADSPEDGAALGWLNQVRGRFAEGGARSCPRVSGR